MEDRAFHNSVRYVTTLLLWTLTLVIFISVAFGLVKWEFALAALAVFLPAPLFFYQYYKWFRIAWSDIRWLMDRDLRRAKERFVQWIW
jgi:hypothetical protein